MRSLVAPASEALTFRVGDVTTMEFEDAFDAVVSFNALHWVRDQQRALGRIAAALHRPARALLVFVCRGPRPSLERVAMQVTTLPRWRPYFTGFADPFVHPDPATHPALVAGCGFTVQRPAVDDLSWDFGSADAFQRWCTVGFGSWTSQLPDDAVDAFMADVIDAYRSATGSAQVFRFTQLTARLTRP